MDLKTDPTSLDPPDAADEKQHHMVRDEVYIDPKEEKALLRKLDRWIVPPVMLLYLFSFLDRVSQSPPKRNSNPNSENILTPPRSTSATPASTAWKKTST
jgi:hypothetical protein